MRQQLETAIRLSLAAQVRNRLAWVLLVAFVPIWYLLIGSMIPRADTSFRLRDAHASYNIAPAPGFGAAVPAAVVSRVAEWALGDQIELAASADHNAGVATSSASRGTGPLRYRQEGGRMGMALCARWEGHADLGGHYLTP